MPRDAILTPSIAWLRRSSLDRRIAHGASPQEARVLARRAEQLTSPRVRRRLAASLRNLIPAAERPRAGFSSTIPLQRSEILASQTLLAKLAEDLDDEGPASARGVALIEELLTDGRSPVYMAHPEGALDEALRHAHAALLLA